MLSGNAGSESHVQSVVTYYLVRHFPWLADNPTALAAPNAILIALRKPAHIAEYGLLAFVIQRFLRVGLGTAGIGLVLLPLLFCGMLGAADEIHQSFVSTRTPFASDVLVDMGGAAIGLLIAALLRRRRAHSVQVHKEAVE